MKFNKFIYLTCLIILMTLQTSCGQKVNTSDIEKYSDQETERILTAMNNEDYDNYSKNFSDVMKKAIPEDIFKNQNTLIKGEIGNYLSKKFVKADIQNKYVRVIYKVNFSNEPKDAYITISFLKGDAVHLVQGLFLTSPKLATK
jgi:hypothetical protein